MTPSTSPTPPAHASYPAPPERRPDRPVARWRRQAALIGAGVLLGVGAGVPIALGAEQVRTASSTANRATAETATSPTSPTSPVEDEAQRPAGLPDTGTFPEPGGSYPGASTTQEQQDDATEAQSTGLVLIDTVLTSGEGAGTGLVLDDDGTVVTNYHVVDGATSVQVTVASTGETYDAEVVGHDEAADVALLQLDGASGLATVTVDDDGDGQVGDGVTVVGNSEGQGYLSSASGEVLATEQDITTSDELTGTDHDLVGLLETDAYAVSGDSGGAMLDEEGEVVGITTAVSSGRTVLSYAVPIDDALAVAEQVESGTETGTVRIGPDAYLGIAVDGDAGGRTDAVPVTSVEDDGAAATAGLAAGDVLTSLDGTDLGSFEDLQAVLADLEPGDVVTLAWSTSTGAERSASVTLGEAPSA